MELAVGDDLTTEELADRVIERIAREQELAVSPRVFMNIETLHPGLSCDDLQQKRGRSNNELTRFRFDVVLRKMPSPETTAIIWIDGSKYHNMEEIHELIRERPRRTLGLRHVPNSRLLHFNDSVERQLSPEEPDSISAVHPEDLWDLASTTPYSVKSFWSATRAGYQDVLLQWNDDRVEFPHRQDWESATNIALATQPMHGRFLRNVVPMLRDYIGQRLPAYMLPAAIVPLDQFPLNANGKVDFESLLRSVPGIVTEHGGKAMSSLEEEVARIWAKVLGIEVVGIRNNFFTELGGHSLLATQVVSRVYQELGINIPLRSMFESPTVAEFAAALSTISKSAEAEPAMIEATSEAVIHSLSDEEVDAMLRRLTE